MKSTVNIQHRNMRHLSWHVLVIIFIMSLEITLVKLMEVPLGISFFLPYYIPDLLLFYINAYVVMKLWKAKGKWIAFLFIIVELVCHFILYFRIDAEVNKSLAIAASRNDYLKAGYRSIYVFGISMAYWIVMRNKRQTKEIYELKLKALELENRQVILENAYLRAKANPHLTFNILDVIHGNLEHTAPAEANVIRLLTDTMDYAIADIGEDGKVSVAEEIDHVKKIIALYQFLGMHSYQVHFTIDVSEDNKQLRLPPLILAMLVDNIFMHGNLTDDEHPATIILAFDNNKLVFRQSNAIAKRKRKSHGLGLEFVRKCLAFYYPERFDLDINTTNDTYSLNLTIDL